MTAKRSGRKRPSMFEVAKLAGVSHQTVSRVINDSPDVSDATRTKVQDAIKALDYRPSNSARALASHRSRTIGLIDFRDRDDGAQARPVHVGDDGA